MSDLIIKKRNNLGLIPEIVGYLSSIRAPDYIFTDYKVRHPGAVFNLATHYVVMDFIELLKELEENQQEYKRDNQLGRKFRNLIGDFFKLYDSCYEVMLGCCKQHSPPSETEFIHRWLKERHDGQKYNVGERFFRKTEKEVKYFRLINNKLKHTSNTIIEEYFQDRSHIIMGFYVEGVIGIGEVGPDDSIHPRYDGGIKSANSYNYKLRDLYYLIYKLSETLKGEIIQHYADVYNLNLDFNESFNNNRKINDNNWRDLLTRIQRLPQEFFPNEFGTNFYEVSEERDNLIFTKKTAEVVGLDGSFGSQRGGDGFTLTWGIPYVSRDTFRE